MSPHITEIDPVTLHRTFEAMERNGGGFCSALAQAWFKADPSNKRRIESAFPHLLADFGPDSRFFYLQNS
jgi:hypothetical protein